MVCRSTVCGSTQCIASRAGRCASAARNTSHRARDAARQLRAMHRFPRWTPHVSRAQCIPSHARRRARSRTQHIPSHARRRASAARNASHPTLDAARQPHAMHRIPRSTPRVSRTQHIPSQARRRASAARNTSQPKLDAARQPHATHRIPRGRRTSAARNTSQPTLDPARQPHATHPIPRSTPRGARVARGAKPSCSLTTVPRRSVAL